MAETSNIWAQIHEIAKSKGVSEAAFRKWQARKAIPGKWQIPILLASSGRLTVEDVATSATKASQS